MLFWHCYDLFSLLTDVENKAELPWAAKNESEKRHEAEFKRRILDLSKVSIGSRCSQEIYSSVLAGCMYMWTSAPLQRKVRSR